MGAMYIVYNKKNRWRIQFHVFVSSKKLHNNNGTHMHMNAPIPPRIAVVCRHPVVRTYTPCTIYVPLLPTSKRSWFFALIMNLFQFLILKLLNNINSQRSFFLNIWFFFCYERIILYIHYTYCIMWVIKTVEYSFKFNQNLILKVILIRDASHNLLFNYFYTLILFHVLMRKRCTILMRIGKQTMRQR